MECYRKSSHTVYDIKYHLVWITKYRKPVLRADSALRVRDLIREICKTAHPVGQVQYAGSVPEGAGFAHIRVPTTPTYKMLAESIGPPEPPPPARPAYPPIRKILA